MYPFLGYIRHVRANVLKEWVHSKSDNFRQFPIDFYQILWVNPQADHRSFSLKHRDQDGVLWVTTPWSCEVLRCSYAPFLPAAYIGPKKPHRHSSVLLLSISIEDQTSQGNSKFEQHVAPCRWFISKGTILGFSLKIRASWQDSNNVLVKKGFT